MKALLPLSFLLFAVSLHAQPADPARVLFDLGTRDEQAGKVERAKLTLLTLASTYANHPLADKAKVEIGAIYLYLEGQAQIQSGKTREGYGTFRLISRAYPESPLSKLADEAAKALGIPPDPRR